MCKNWTCEKLILDMGKAHVQHILCFYEKGFPHKKQVKNIKHMFNT